MGNLVLKYYIAWFNILNGLNPLKVIKIFVFRVTGYKIFNLIPWNIKLEVMQGSYSRQF